MIFVIGFLAANVSFTHLNHFSLADSNGWNYLNHILLQFNYFAEKGTATKVLSQIKINSAPSPTFSTEIVNCSKTLSCAITGVSITKASVAGFRCAVPSKLTPQDGISELNTTCQVSGLGTVHRLYFPAFKTLSPNFKSLFVSNVVGSFAPVRQVLP